MCQPINTKTFQYVSIVSLIIIYAINLAFVSMLQHFHMLRTKLFMTSNQFDCI